MLNTISINYILISTILFFGSILIDIILFIFGYRMKYTPLRMFVLGILLLVIHSNKLAYPEYTSAGHQIKWYSSMDVKSNLINGDILIRSTCYNLSTYNTMKGLFGHAYIYYNNNLIEYSNDGTVHIDELSTILTGNMMIGDVKYTILRPSKKINLSEIKNIERITYSSIFTFFPTKENCVSYIIKLMNKSGYNIKGYFLTPYELFKIDDLIPVNNNNLNMAI